MPSEKISTRKFSLKENMIFLAIILFITGVILTLVLFRSKRPLRTSSYKKPVKIVLMDNPYSGDGKYILFPDHYPDDTYKEFLYLYSRGKLEQCAALLRDRIKAEDDKKVIISVYNNLAGIYNDLGQFGRAEDLYRSALKEGIYKAEILYNRGINFYHMGNTEQSLKSFQESYQLEHGLYRNVLTLGNLLFETGSPEEAEKLYKKIPSSSVLYRQARYNLAVLLFSGKNKSDKAVRQWQKLTGEADQIGYLSALSLGNHEYENGNYKQAVSYYLTACSIQTQNYMAWFNLGILERQTGEPKQAIEYFQNALRHRKNLSDAYQNLGEIYYTSSDYHSSLVNYKKMTRLTNDPAARAILADLYYLSGQYPEAYSSYAEVLDLPNNTLKKTALVNSGNILYKLGNNERALHYYEQARMFDPEDSRIFYNLGMAYRADGRLTQAAENFQTALALSPQNTEYMSRIVLTLYEKGSSKEAIRLCRQFSDQTRENTILPYILAVLQFKDGNYTESLTLLGQTDSMDPVIQQNIHMLRGLALAEQNQPEKALREFDNVLALNNENLTALFNRSLILYRQNRYKEAISGFLQVVSSTEDPVRTGLAYFNAGNALYRLGELDSAAEYYQLALEYIPDSNDIHFNLALIREQ